MSIFSVPEHVREVFISEDIKEMSNDEIREVLIGATRIMTDWLYEDKEVPIEESMAAAINFAVNFLGAVLEATNRRKDQMKTVDQLNNLFKL